MPLAWLPLSMVDSTASVIESTIVFMEGMGLAIFYLGLGRLWEGFRRTPSLVFLFPYLLSWLEQSA
jgi:hypothetical protein